MYLRHTSIPFLAVLTPAWPTCALGHWSGWAHTHLPRVYSMEHTSHCRWMCSTQMWELKVAGQSRSPVWPPTWWSWPTAAGWLSQRQGTIRGWSSWWFQVGILWSQDKGKHWKGCICNSLQSTQSYSVQCVHIHGHTYKYRPILLSIVHIPLYGTRSLDYLGEIPKIWQINHFLPFKNSYASRFSIQLFHELICPYISMIILFVTICFMRMYFPITILDFHEHPFLLTFQRVDVPKK